MLLISLLVACIVFRFGLATDQAVQTDLQESVVDELLKCINALSNNYRVYVDTDGHVVIIPAERRAIDLTGADKGLAACMQLVLNEMTVTAESTVYDDPSHDSSVDTKSADFALLQRKGGKAQPPRPDNAAPIAVPSASLAERSNGQLTKRCASYYGALLDDHAGCRNYNYNNHFLGSCVNHMSSYASVFYYNPDVCNTILMKIWPHHRCSQGNQQAFYVGPKTYSSCHTRTTYSFRGVKV